MEDITIYPVYIADLEIVEDMLYTLRQKVNSPKVLKDIDKRLMSIERKFRDFHASLPNV